MSSPDPKPRPRIRATGPCSRGHDPIYRRPNGRGATECLLCQRENRARWRERNRERALERERTRRAALRSEGVEVTCPDCGQSRRLAQRPVSGRCPSCAARRRDERRRAASKRRRVCDHCGEEFVARRLDIRFCSSACRVKGGGYAELGRKLSIERGGDGNPSYRTGKRVGVHIPGWRLQKKGESACRNCGSRRGVQLHHAVPRGLWPGGRADLRNGIPLCIDCHSGWHHRKLTIYREIFRADEWEFISSAQLTGRRIEAWLDDRYPSRPAIRCAS